MLGRWLDRLLAAAYRSRLRTSYSHMQQRSQVISNPWHAISIVPGANACEAAIEKRGRRALSAEAARLPLADCQHPGACTCHYQHHQDRRRDRRRARDNGLPARLYSGGERRGPARGRRATDVSERNGG
ncbi:MAG TPA: hypothetical protein VJ011_05885 [Steroidobacteraceae bacterium]|nr:hypothetical protein [Steroidobacteraceae bacterium]